MAARKNGNGLVNLLKEYPRAVVHLRQRHWGSHTYIGPVFGAGISYGLKIPDWKQLIKRISEHSDVDGATLCTANDGPVRHAQLLFQRFRERHFNSLGKTPIEGADYQDVLTRWLKIVRDCLYDKAPDFKDAWRTHPYLKSFLPIIKKAQLTINYNFDSAIEYGLEYVAQKEQASRGFQTVVNPDAQFRPGLPVICHPNGYLPRERGETLSETIVFSDESFADQLLHSMAGQYTSLINHFTRITCLFVGLSLEDATLRHILRRSATVAPGHVHYFVRYTEDPNSLSPEEKAAISSSYFDVYNLVTLFLNDEGLANLARLVTMPTEEFRDLAQEADIPVRFRYFLLGSVGVGKSTALSNLRSLETYDEWLAPKPPVLLKPPETLTPAEKRSADAWISRQFMSKNRILEDIKEGIHVSDRCPLDPITFQEDAAAMKKRAIQLIDSLKAPVTTGHLIIMSAELGDVMSRLRKKHKTDWTEDAVSDLKCKIKDVYKGLTGVSYVSTSGRNIAEVTHEIARIIHFCEYSEAQLDGRLKEIAKGVI